MDFLKLSAVALIVVLAIFASPANAQKPEIRRITQTDATSNCIGDPNTPLCAAETYLACSVRRDRSLCDAVNISRQHYFGPPDLVTELMEYIVELQYLNRPKKVVGSAKGTARQKLGSVEIYLKMKEYYRDPAKWPKSEWSSYFIEVQKTGEGWKVISWAGVSKEFKE